MVLTDQERKSLYAGIGKRIQDLRIARGLTQSQLATAISLSRTSITNIENGRQKVLVHTLVEIASALDVRVGDILQTFRSVESAPVKGTVFDKLNDADRKLITTLVSPNQEKMGT